MAFFLQTRSVFYPSSILLFQHFEQRHQNEFVCNIASILNRANSTNHPYNIVNLKYFLIGFNLSHESSAEATVAEIVNKMRIHTHIFGRSPNNLYILK